MTERSLPFEDQEHLAIPDLAARAAALGLDVDRLTAEVVDHMHAGRVREDFLSGVRSGVNGTPTFFVNGVRHDGAPDYPSLLAALQRSQARGR